jgi:hypothetical protein
LGNRSGWIIRSALDARAPAEHPRVRDERVGGGGEPGLVAKVDQNDPAGGVRDDSSATIGPGRGVGERRLR